MASPHTAGAVACLVRSVTARSLSTTHTGIMHYADPSENLPRIPAAAITLEDAELLHRQAERGLLIRIHMEMGAHVLPDAESANDQNDTSSECGHHEQRRAPAQSLAQNEEPGDCDDDGMGRHQDR